MQPRERLEQFCLSLLLSLSWSMERPMEKQMMANKVLKSTRFMTDINDPAHLMSISQMGFRVWLNLKIRSRRSIAKPLSAEIDSWLTPIMRKTNPTVVKIVIIKLKIDSPDAKCCAKEPSHTIWIRVSKIKKQFKNQLQKLIMNLNLIMIILHMKMKIKFKLMMVMYQMIQMMVISTLINKILK